MKKIIACLLLAMVMGTSGCISFAPAEPGENRSWKGIEDPYLIRGVK